MQMPQTGLSNTVDGKSYCKANGTGALNRTFASSLTNRQAEVFYNTGIGGTPDHTARVLIRIGVRMTQSDVTPTKNVSFTGVSLEAIPDVVASVAASDFPNRQMSFRNFPPSI
jgi:hypothetical protein